MGFFKKLKKLSEGKLRSLKCDQCNNQATRTMSRKDGKEVHLCSNCYVIMYLGMMVQRQLFEQSLLHKAFSARKSGKFGEALVAFEIIVEKIEKLIEDHYKRLISPSKSQDEKKSVGSILLDFLDVYSYIHFQAGSCAFQASQSASLRFDHLRADIISIEHLLKAIQNKLPYRYLTCHGKFEPGMAMEDLPLTDISRPFNVLKTCEISPIIDFEKLKLELIPSEADQGVLVSNIIRYHNDLLWFAECYTALGKSLLHLGTFPRQVFIARNDSEAASRTELAKKIVPHALALAFEVFGLSRECIEKLPVTEETFRQRAAYGTTFFDEGVCLSKQKRFTESTKHFMRALSIYKSRDHNWPPPPNAELGITDCYLHIGECHVALGNDEQARKNLEKCLKTSKNLGVQDNIKRAKELLQKLEG